MNRKIKKILVALLIVGITVVLVFLCAFEFKPVGDVVFSVCFGSGYRKAGEATLHNAGKDEILSIYKAPDKPFLILGPYRFAEDDYDFFFVNRTQVIRTATDKGGDTWIRIAKWLFLLDDMTGNDRLRAPYWDDIQSDKGGSIVFEPQEQRYIFTFKLNSQDPMPVSFAIPARFFTSDMPPFAAADLL